MALLGQAALAMWWNIAPEVRADFEDWHAHEHFPERLAIPGFLRATRWCDADRGDAMFVMYELAEHAVLASPAYAARLNAPSPWSTRLMPHHREMVRSQCRVLASHGGGIARHALTVRFAAAAHRETALQAFFEALIPMLAARPGLTGAHLLRHEKPALPTTTEQKIRQAADRIAEWVFVVCGYDIGALRALRDAELAPVRVADAGALMDASARLFTLAYSATPGDMR